MQIGKANKKEPCHGTPSLSLPFHMSICHHIHHAWLLHCGLFGEMRPRLTPVRTSQIKEKISGCAGEIHSLARATELTTVPYVPDSTAPFAFQIRRESCKSWTGISNKQAAAYATFRDEHYQLLALEGTDLLSCPLSAPSLVFPIITSSATGPMWCEISKRFISRGGIRISAVLTAFILDVVEVAASHRRKGRIVASADGLTSDMFNLAELLRDREALRF